MQQGPHYEDSTRQTVVKFLRQLIDPRGIWAVPEKISAILEMEPPHNITKLHRFMGMANQMAKSWGCEGHAALHHLPTLWCIHPSAVPSVLFWRWHRFSSLMPRFITFQEQRVFLTPFGLQLEVLPK